MTTPIREQRSDSALTLLVGVGAAGSRVASEAHHRLEQLPSSTPHGTELFRHPTPDTRHPAFSTPDTLHPTPYEMLTFEAQEPDLSKSLRAAAYRLTRQQTVGKIEQEYAIRQPIHRYLRLNLICVAALSEVSAQTLTGCLEAIYSLNHPAAGMEVLFVLDAAHPDDPDEVADGALTTLEALQNAWCKLDARSRHDWATAPRARFFVVHPHRADGSHLDYGYRVSGVGYREEPRGGDQRIEQKLSSPSGEVNQSDQSSDSSNIRHPIPDTRHLAFPTPDPRPLTPVSEFESALATAIAEHVAPGALHDALAPPVPEEEQPPFALLGWAADTFPRELILGRVSRLLATDVLERSARPEPGQDRAEEMLDAAEPDRWQEWRQAEKESLLDRRALVTRLLTPGTQDGSIEVTDSRPPPVRRSYYQRMRASYFGDQAPDPDSRQPLRVRLTIPMPGWQIADMRRWPQQIQALDKAGVERFDEVIRALNERKLPQQVAEEVAVALVRCADLCVKRHLGGTAAARTLMEDAIHTAEQRVQQENTVRFAEPYPPAELGLKASGGLQEAFEEFQRRCERLPSWQGAMARGLAYGALCATACLSLAWPLWLAYAGVVLSFAGFVGHYGWSLGRLKQLGDYMAECVRAKYGRRLFDYAQQAAGTPPKEGVYQAISRFLREVEIPTVQRFDTERDSYIAQIRQNTPFPVPGGTDEWMADETDAEHLYEMLREQIGEQTLADETRSLLRAGNLFETWRYPVMERILQQISQAVRPAHLLPWEQPNRSLGDFMRALLGWRQAESSVEPRFRMWVRGRLDRLAMRSLPLALRVPTHPERASENDDLPVQNRVLFAVPASLQWRRVALDAQGDTAAPPLDPLDEDGEVPAGTAAAGIAAWFGVGTNSSRVLSQEHDSALSVITSAGLTQIEALRALGVDPTSPPDALITQKGRRGEGEKGRNPHSLALEPDAIIPGNGASNGAIDLPAPSLPDSTRNPIPEHLNT